MTLWTTVLNDYYCFVNFRLHDNIVWSILIEIIFLGRISRVISSLKSPCKIRIWSFLVKNIIN
jgi:hypothetical protein